jgi:hypothetical protein
MVGTLSLPDGAENPPVVLMLHGFTGSRDEFPIADSKLGLFTGLELHVAIYEATHNLVLLHVMRALSALLRSDVFHTRERLYARPKVRELLRDQHRAIYEAIAAGDGPAATEAAQAHLTYVRQAALEIRAAEEQLEVSWRRLEGGNVSFQARRRRDRAAAEDPARATGVPE